MANSANDDGVELHVLRGRKALESAGFILPFLRKDMRLLDAGCGPGPIAMDLAEILIKGEVVGIDTDSNRINLAKQGAHQRNIGNVSFQIGDVFSLPFGDESFDFVFMHALLYHLPDPDKAVGEAARVLKSGGFVAVCDSDFGGNVFTPTNKTLDRAFELDQRLHQQSGDPFLGRRHRAILRKAGFTDVCTSARYENWTRTGEDIRNCGETWARYFAEASREKLLNHRLTSVEELEEICRAFLDWSINPDSVFIRCRCEAVARKP